MDRTRLHILEGPAGDDEAAGSAQPRRSDLQRRPLRSLLVGRIVGNRIPGAVARAELEKEVDGARPGSTGEPGRRRCGLERGSSEVSSKVGPTSQRESVTGHPDVRRLAGELRRPPQLPRGLRPRRDRLV